MKRSLIFLLALTMALPALAQDSSHKMVDTIRTASDSSHAAGNVPARTDSDDNFSIVLLIFGIGFLVVLAVGLVATVVLCGIAVMLTLGGILSFSLIIGLYKRSLKTGVRWAVFLLFGAGGAVAGVLSYFVFLVIRKLHFVISTPVLVSGAAGLAGGLICGAIFLMLLNRMYNYLQNRLTPVKKNQ